MQVFDARGSDDIAPAVTAMTEWRAEAGLVLDEGIFVSNRTLIAALSADQHLPLACGFHEMVEAGCLMSYSVNLPAINDRAASYVEVIE